jgi:hypothetical protein
MAKTTIKTGTQVKFIGSAEYDGQLAKGATVTIKGFDPEEGTYAVEDEEGLQDSLFDTEFEVIEAKAKTKAKPAAEEAKPATKTAAKAKVKTAEEEEAPRTKSKGRTDTEVKGKGKTEAKAKAKAKVKEEEEVIPLPKFKTTASVKAALDEHEGDALAAAHELAESSEKTVFTLGGVLAYIKRNDLHTSVESEETDEEGNSVPAYAPGLKGFNAYVEDTLGIAARKADYFVNLYEKFSQITTEAKIAKIGWTKLRELLPLDLDESNVEEWLDYAKETPTVDLKEAVREQLVDAGGKTHGNRKTATMVTRKFRFFEDQDNVVKEAIDKAREVIGDDQDDSACILHILNEWIALG